MSTLFQAALFGAVQGLTEFLPVSSSGHLLLLHSLTHFSVGDDLGFDVALHVGTLLALLVFFWRDLETLFRAWVRSFSRFDWHDDQQRLAWLLVVAAIPALVAGALLETAAEQTFRSPVLVAINLIVAGIFLWLVDRTANRQGEIKHLGFFQALGIGIGQAAAVLPGVSRSGATMTTGRLVGLSRATAARFSFLLATPIIAGAGLKKIFDFQAEQLSATEVQAILVGALTAAVVGYLTIRWLLRYVSGHSYGVFAAYRILLGLLVLVWVWLR